MSSSAKTDKLRLNKWAGDDKPKREDFNSDNEIIDGVLGGHVADAVIHVTPEEKEHLRALYKTGTYLGTGEAEKTVPLLFNPKTVFVFANNRPFIWTDSDGTVTAGSGAAAGGNHTPGLQISGSGFKASNTDGAASEWSAALNKSGLTYFYIAFA